MSRHFWLAHYLQANLCLVDIRLPKSWFRWLLSRFFRAGREWRLQEAKRLAFQRDELKCRTDMLEVPNLTIGIVEAAWRVRPNFIVLSPELQKSLGKPGLRDLKNRLSEMSQCMLVLLRTGPAIRLEPCTAADPNDRGQLIRVRFR